jgi:hypothetical protein
MAYRRLAAELRDYQDMPASELRRLVGRFIELTTPLEIKPVPQDICSQRDRLSSLTSGSKL